MSISPNTTLAQYTIISKIGEGGMGEVWRARGAEFQLATATARFETRMFADSSVFHEFSVSHDGQRFLVDTLIGDTKSPRPTVILNWPAALKKQEAN